MSTTRPQPDDDAPSARRLADRHLDTLDHPYQLTIVIQLTRLLQRLSPIDRYKIETQLTLEHRARIERDGEPPNEADELAAWEARVRAADAASQV